MRPDICYCVQLLARFSSKVNRIAAAGLTHLLQFCYNTRSQTLMMGGDRTSVAGFSDSDYGGDRLTRRSVASQAAIPTTFTFPTPSPTAVCYYYYMYALAAPRYTKGPMEGGPSGATYEAFTNYMYDSPGRPSAYWTEQQQARLPEEARARCLACYPLFW
jgi:hypothetical protein